MTGWGDLKSELAQWPDRSLPFWWRDDDAVADTPALRRLSREAVARDLPVFIAVIPAHLDPSLPDLVNEALHMYPIVHGWAHQNHEPEGTKKAEFGPARSLDDVVDDAARGLTKLRMAFGDRLCRMFVPPWNRVRPDLMPPLPDLGYAAVSTFLPRKAVQAAPGLVQINTHVDPIDWRGTRSLADEAYLLAQLVAHLKDRRAGRADGSEPLGLLTHHLVHDPAIWSFCAKLTDYLLTGPAFAWQPGKDLAT